MNLSKLIFIITFLLSCNHTNEEQKIDINKTEINSKDFLYEKMTLEQIEIDSNFSLQPINVFDKGIRFIGEDSWGSFKYIISIYESDGECYKKLIFNHYSRYLEKDQSFRSFHEISCDYLNEKILELAENNFLGIDKYEDLMDGVDVIDGYSHYLIINDGKQNYVKYWKENETNIDNRKKELVSFSISILKKMGFPRNKYVIYKEKKNEQYELNIYPSSTDDYVEKVKIYLNGELIKGISSFPIRLQTKDYQKMIDELVIEEYHYNGDIVKTDLGDNTFIVNALLKW